MADDGERTAEEIAMDATPRPSKIFLPARTMNAALIVAGLSGVGGFIWLHWQIHNLGAKVEKLNMDMLDIAQQLKAPDGHGSLQTEDVASSPKRWSSLPLKTNIDLRIGSPNDSAALQAATLSAGSAHLVRVPGGTYALPRTVHTPNGGSWQFETGVNFTSGVIDAVADMSPLQGKSGIAWARRMGEIGNENTAFFTGEVPPTNSIAAYEKTVINCSIGTSDATRDTAKYRDAVCGQFSAQINPGTKAGRTWSVNSNLTVPTNADGFAIGYELDLLNNGSLGAWNTPKAKLGAHLVALGTTDSTAGSLLNTSGGAGRWYDGYTAIPAAIRHDFIRLGTRIGSAGPSGDLFSVDAAGNQTAKTSKITPTTVAALPECERDAEGTLAYVTDAATTTSAAVPRGGGNHGTIVLCSRSGPNMPFVWTIH